MQQSKKKPNEIRKKKVKRKKKSQITISKRKLNGKKKTYEIK